MLWRVRSCRPSPLSEASGEIVAGTDRALTGLAGQVADQVSDDIFLDESGRLGSVRYNTPCGR